MRRASPYDGRTGAVLAQVIRVGEAELQRPAASSAASTGRHKPAPELSRKAGELWGPVLHHYPPYLGVLSHFARFCTCVLRSGWRSKLRPKRPKIAAAAAARRRCRCCCCRCCCYHRCCCHCHHHCCCCCCADAAPLPRIAVPSWPSPWPPPTVHPPARQPARPPADHHSRLQPPVRPQRHQLVSVDHEDVVAEDSILHQRLQLCRRARRD